MHSVSPDLDSTRSTLHDSVTTKIPHPASTRYDEDEASYHGATDSDDENTYLTPKRKRRKVIPDYSLGSSGLIVDNLDVSPSLSGRFKDLRNKDAQAYSGGINAGERDELKSTVRPIPQLEEALPPVKTDLEAIEAYEAYRAAEVLEQPVATDNGGKPDTDDNSDNLDTTLSLKTRLGKREWIKGRSSIYVDAFNLALLTVLEDESHLFNAAEIEVFKHWERLSYEAQYLYVRLFLRKTSAWFRVAKLTYYGDIADMEAAVDELQVQRQLPEQNDAVEGFPGEKAVPDEAQPLGTTFVFAERSDDNITTLDEASSLLLLDELKSIAKDVKVAGKNKTELLKNFRRTSGRQRGLNFLKRSETEDSGASDHNTSANADIENEGNDYATPEDTMTPTTMTAAAGNRDDLFTRKILEQTGKCIRLSLIPLKLFERVHLVFYRSTEWTEKSLTTLILAKISRRIFPEYVVSRSATIFESRSLLLEFEASLRTQFRVDCILEFNGTPTRQGLEEVKSVFEAVYPRWKFLVMKEQQKEDRVYESGEGAYLRRFSPAWVYTRIVHKALGILAKFKEHLREHKLLCELLQQRLFHAARRGSWYSRKALLEEHYMYDLTPSDGRSEEVNKKHWKRIALRTCEQGLQDNECHVIYHYDLQKRIKKLERQLRVPKREQHDFGHVGLRKARERTVQGIKIERDEPSRPMLRRKSSASSNSRSVSRERTQAGTASNGPAEIPPTLKRQSTKTIWHDELDTSLPVSVESMCLSYYRKVHGYKGYHSEGGILRTLFGLLFFDVLFGIYVPNVFQTAYQTCPLDLHTDAFYSARISEINQLINRIANGEAESIIRTTWSTHFETKTCIVGVRWDAYELEDLIEIVKCWDREALGVVMRVIAQEYGARGGGVPDLFLWKVNNAHTSSPFKHAREDEQSVEPEPDNQQIAGSKSNSNDQVEPRFGKVVFSEVKSENDRLSDTQRLWISVLLNAGVEVELCHAVAAEVIKQ